MPSADFRRPVCCSREPDSVSARDASLCPRKYTRVCALRQDCATEQNKHDLTLPVSYPTIFSSTTATTLILRQLSTVDDATNLLSRESDLTGGSRTAWLNIHGFIQAGLNRFVQEQAGALVRKVFVGQHRTEGGVEGMSSVSPEVGRLLRHAFGCSFHISPLMYTRIFLLSRFWLQWRAPSLELK